MKFGATLDQRSYPEWRAYNIDYVDIKHVIKRHTTAHPPVDSPDISPEYENELFNIFAEQLDRINLFVKSKTGELKSRLVSFRRQVVALKRRGPGRPMSRAANYYAKLELEVERAGNDLQRLARYIILQRAGFRKLLKKYRKWSGSDCLSQRFGILLESPNAFHHQNFDEMVLEVSELLATIRDGINNLAQEAQSSPETRFDTLALSAGAKSAPLRRGTSSSSLLSASEFREPNGDAGRTTFWVHADHVIELQFLLLKHFVIASSPPSTRGSAPGMSRANSSNSFASGKENEVATVVLDDMDLTQLLSSPSNLPEKYAAHVTWRTQSTDAKIYTPHLSGTSSELVVKRKYAECVVHPDINQSNIQYKDETVERQIKEAQDWFTQHREVKPLVKTWFKRTRFVGRTPSGHAWAFLDRDIKMRALHGAPQWSTDELSNGKDVVGFPHALCVIRWEGDMVPAVVDEINRSNLAMRVDTFSLDTHAVATLYGGPTASPWNDCLQKGIRSLPPLGLGPRRSSRRSSMAVPTGSSSKNSSATGGTVDTAMHESSVTSDGGVADWESLANRKKKPRRKRKVLIKSISGQRYWNELEGDGDDNDPEPFTILIASDRKLDEDDDEDLSLSAYIVGSVNRALHALGSTFRVQRTDLGTNERTSLLDHDPHNLDGDSSSDEESRFPSGRGGYGTQTSGVRRRRRRIARHVLFLFAAFFSLAFAAAIALEDSLSGRKRKRRDPAEHLLLDFGVLAFLLGSLGFAVLGLAMFLMHHRTMTWIHSCLVWTAFVIIMAGNGAVAALQGRTQIEN